MKIRQNRDKVFVFRCDDGNFATWYSFAHEAMDFAGDVRILALVSFEGAEFDAGFFWWIFGGDVLVNIDAWGFAEAVGALFDDAMGELKDWFAGTVVFG